MSGVTKLQAPTINGVPMRWAGTVWRYAGPDCQVTAWAATMGNENKSGYKCTVRIEGLVGSGEALDWPEALRVACRDLRREASRLSEESRKVSA